MRVIFLTLIWCLSLAAQAPKWSVATELPSVDLNGLTAAHKQFVLKLLREEPCQCGCTMKIAECRVEDPKCQTSRGLAARAIKAIREGKTPVQVKEALHGPAGAEELLSEAVTLQTEGAPVKGPSTARITLVEFSDFECPYCSQAVLDLDTVLKAFPKDVKLVYKQFPLSEIHRSAVLAASASLAANAQGKFWPLHDRMYANHTRLTRENILIWAKELGCDMSRFTADMDSAKTRQQVARDVKQGEEAGVEGTPTVFVNGKHYNGSLSAPEFGQVLRQELKAAR